MTWDGTITATGFEQTRIRTDDREVLVELEVTLHDDEEAILESEDTEIRIPVR